MTRTVDAPRSLRRRIAAAAVVGVALTTSVSCAATAKTPVGETTSAARSSSPSPSPSPSPEPPPPPPPVLWPLTGVESGPVPARPAVAVKIENSVAARPQTGLNSADMVWEQVVEGGITRFVAVYHSTLPPQIGPVRSVRPMDAPIAAPLQGLFAFSGGVPQYVSAISGAGLQVLSHDGGASGFYRLGTRYAPHNVYADPSAFLAQADPAHAAAPPPQFLVAGPDAQASAAVAGRPATTLRLRLSGVSYPTWTWSPADARWVRAEGATPAVEADGTPLRAVNVVVLRVVVANTSARDPAGNPVPETQMVGAGEALVATGGRVLHATWAKNSPGEPVALTDGNGRPVLLAPGNTWVELVPTATGSTTIG